MPHNRIAGSIAVGFVLGLISAIPVLAADDAQCPGASGGQSFPFDGRNVVFDNVVTRLQDGRRMLTNCIMISKATHGYHIDWKDVGINASTEGGYLMSSRYLGDDPKVDASTAYVGVNRTKFSPGALIEKTFIVKLTERLEARLLGAISTVAQDQPETVREAKLEPVDFQFTVQLVEPGNIRLEYLDNIPKRGGSLGFALPDDLRNTLSDLNRRQFSLGGERTIINYRIGQGEPIAVRAILTIQNSDYQNIGTAPATIIVSRP